MQTEEDYEELQPEHRQCETISYFGQSYERFDSGITSEAILRTLHETFVSSWRNDICQITRVCLCVRACVRAVERGCKNLGFKNLKKSKFYVFRFFRKTLKIQILDSQSQQKIVVFQSN